jgi:hypothetical protein
MFLPIPPDGISPQKPNGCISDYMYLPYRFFLQNGYLFDLLRGIHLRIHGKGSPKGERFAGRDMAGNMRCGNHNFYGKGSPKGERFAGRDMAGNMRCGNHNIYGKGSPNGEHFAGQDMGGEKHIFYGKGSPNGELFAGRDMGGRHKMRNDAAEFP